MLVSEFLPRFLQSFSGYGMLLMIEAREITIYSKVLNDSPDQRRNMQDFWIISEMQTLYIIFDVFLDFKLMDNEIQKLDRR